MNLNYNDDYELNYNAVVNLINISILFRINILS